MHIPSYQVHNVLKVYSKQVSKSRFVESQKNVNKQPSVDKINIFAEGKRQAVIDKVAADIVDRITRYGPQDDVDRAIVSQLEEEIGEQVGFKEHKNTEFVYDTIDDNNQRTRNVLSVDDSDFLMKRLEELTKKAVDRNMEY